MEKKTELSSYNNSWYNPGKGLFVRTLWYFVNAVIFNSPIFPFSGLKVFLLRLFGASVGKGCFIKPAVNIKYPWKLVIGENTWIGEGVWIDNLDQVEIGSNCCLSQGAFLFCGNHNYKKSTFDLMIAPIVVENGAWLGAKSVVGPGVRIAAHAVLTTASTASKNLEEMGIYRGNPAVFIKKRVFLEE